MAGVQNFEPLPGPPKNEYQHIIPRSIGSIIRGCKIGVTNYFRTYTDIYDVWQRNFHEHVIRDERSYLRISEYIVKNPELWEQDKFYRADITREG